MSEYVEDWLRRASSRVAVPFSRSERFWTRFVCLSVEGEGGEPYGVRSDEECLEELELSRLMSKPFV
ncbi:hypothetical protein Bca4012_065705 [Brassica carinata]